MSPAEVRDRCRALAESCRHRALSNEEVDEVAWLLALADELGEIADSPD